MLSRHHRLSGTWLLMLWALVFSLRARAGELADQRPNNARVKEPVATISLAVLENRSPVLEADWVAAAAPDLLSAHLANNPWLLVLERAAVADLGREHALGQRQPTAGLAPTSGGATSSAAVFVLGGWFEVTEGKLKLELQIAQADGKAVWSQRLEGHLDSIGALCQQAARYAGDAIRSRVAGGGLPLPGTQIAAAELPVVALIPFYRGKRAFERGDHARALAEFLRAARKAPEYGEAWRYMGMALESLGHPNAAMRAYEQVLTIDFNDPGAAKALWQLAHVAEDLPDQSIAIRHYHRLLAEYPFSHRLVHTEIHTIDKVPYAKLAGQRLIHLHARREEWEEAYRIILDQPQEQAPVAAQRGRFEAQALRTSGHVPGFLAAANLTSGVPCAVSAYGNCGTIADGNPPWHNSYCLVAPAERGRMFDTIDFEVTGVAVPLTVSLQLPGSPSFQYVPVELEELSATANSRKARMRVPDQYAAGFDMQLPPQLRPSDQVSWTLTATLKDMQPGVLLVETQPTFAQINVDGVERGFSPCHIRNIAPGKHKLQVVPQHARHAAQDAVVEVASTGQTRVAWTLPYPSVGWPASWSLPRLAVSYRLDMDITAVRAAWHPQLGWVLAWSSDGSLYVSTAADGATWTPPRRLSGALHAAEEETLHALLIAPNTGRTVIIFHRQDELYVAASDDLLAWSVPKLLLGNATRPSVESATVSPVGRFLAKIGWQWCGDFGSVPLTVQSGDGLVWTSDESAFSGTSTRPPPNSLPLSFETEHREGQPLGPERSLARAPSDETAGKATGERLLCAGVIRNSIWVCCSPSSIAPAAAGDSPVVSYEKSDASGSTGSAIADSPTDTQAARTNGWGWIIGGVAGVVLIAVGGAVAFRLKRGKRRMKGMHGRKPFALLGVCLLCSCPFRTAAEETQPTVQERVVRVRDLKADSRLTEALAAQLLQDPAPEVRSAVILALNQLSMGAARKQFDWARKYMLRAVQDKDAIVRCPGIGGLGIFAQPSSEEISAVCRALEAPDGDTRNAAMYYFNSHPRPEAMQTITRFVTIPDGQTAQEALRLLKKAKYTGLADVAASAPSMPSPGARYEALRILGELNDRRATDVAEILRHDPVNYVRDEALKVLQRPGADFVLGQMTGDSWKRLDSDGKRLHLHRLSMLEPDRQEKEFSSLYAMLDAEQRRVMIGAMPYGSPFLLSRLKDTDSAIRAVALKRLTPQNYRDSCPAGVVEAMELLKDPDPAVAKAATEKLLRDVFKYVKREACRRGAEPWAFARKQVDLSCWDEATQTKQTLLAALRNKDPQVRLDAARHLRGGAWDDADLRGALLNGLEEFVAFVPEAPETKEGIDALLQTLAGAPAPRKRAVMEVLARSDDDAARAVVRNAAPTGAAK